MLGMIHVEMYVFPPARLAIPIPQLWQRHPVVSVSSGPRIPSRRYQPTDSSHGRRADSCIRYSPSSSSSGSTRTKISSNSPSRKDPTSFPMPTGSALS